VRNWSNYVHTLAAVVKRPPWAVVTQIHVVPHPKNQFEMKFEALDGINNQTLLGQLKDLRDKAFKLAMAPYDKPSDEPPKPEPKKAVGKRKF